MAIKITNNTGLQVVADALLEGDSVEIEVVSLQKLAEQSDFVRSYIGPNRNIEFAGAFDQGQYRVFMRLVDFEPEDHV